MAVVLHTKPKLFKYGINSNNLYIQFSNDTFCYRIFDMGDRVDKLKLSRNGLKNRDTYGPLTVFTPKDPNLNDESLGALQYVLFMNHLKFRLRDM